MAKGDLNTLYCSTCGSDHVEMKTWVNPNTQKITGWLPDIYDVNDYYCHSCQQNDRELLTLVELWDIFSGITVNENDEIEEDFLSFPAGTPKTDVWHWFDERCPNNLHDDLMYPSK